MSIATADDMMSEHGTGKGAERTARVLVVDDEPDLIELVSMTLSRMNLIAEGAADIAQARKHLDSTQFDLCLTDMKLPDGDGLDLVKWIQKNQPDLPVAV